jgi:hypothetical protein
MTFLSKTSETNKFVKIFFEAFLILKKYFASTIKDFFHFYKKGLSIQYGCAFLFAWCGGGDGCVPPPQ